MWRYRNPVEVRFGAGTFDGLGKALAGRSYCLVTYDDANGGGTFAELTRASRLPWPANPLPWCATSAPIRISSASRSPAGLYAGARGRSRRSWPWAAAR